MEIKKNSRRREDEEIGSSTPASTPATAPGSRKSIRGTPFTPSSYGKTVLLFDWWLIKAEKDCNGKRLAVAGMNAKGQQATRVFSSAPIIKRYDAYTLETADGITVRIQGFIDKARTHHNGIPPEVCRCFLIGFPYNWVHYADEYFGNKCTSTSILTSASGVDEQSKHSSDGAGNIFPIHLDEFPVSRILDVLTSSSDTSIDDVLKRNFTHIAEKFSDNTLINTTVHVPSDITNCHLSVMNASLPVETLSKYEMDKSNQNHESSVGCSHMIGHDAECSAADHAEEAGCYRNEMHVDGVAGENSVIDKRANISHNVSLDTSLTVNQNSVSQPGTGMQCETLLEKITDLEKDNNLVRPLAVNFDIVDPLPNVMEGNFNDESTTVSIDMRIKCVSNDLLPKENKLSHLKQCKELRNYALRNQNHAEKTRVHGVDVSEDLPVRKDSNSSTVKMNLPLETSLEHSPNAAQSNLNDESTPNLAGLAIKSVSLDLLPNENKLSHPKHGRELGNYASRSQNRAERTRVNNIGDSKDLVVRKDTDTNEDNSLTVKMNVLFEYSPNGKEGELNDKPITNSADFGIKSFSNSLLPNEITVSHHKHGNKLRDYALRSRSCAEKIGVHSTVVSEDLLARKDSDRKDANSLTVKMNAPFGALLESGATKSCKTSNRKEKGYKTRSKISSKNEIIWPSSSPVSQGDEDIYRVEREPRGVNRLEEPTDKFSRISKQSSSNKINDICLRIFEKIENCSFHAMKDHNAQIGAVVETKKRTSVVGGSLLKEPLTKLVWKRGSDRLAELKKIEKEDKKCAEFMDRKTFVHSSTSTPHESISDGMNKFKQKLTGESPSPATEDFLFTENTDGHLNCGSASQIVDNSSYNTSRRHRRISASVVCKSQSLNEEALFLSKEGMELVETATNSEARASSSRMKKLKNKGKDDQTMKSRVEVENEGRSVTVDHNFANASSDVKQFICMHAQHLVTIGVEKGTFVSSPKGSDNKHCSELRLCSVSTPASNDERHKHGDEHSGDQNSLHDSDENKSFKSSVCCPVKIAIHSDISGVVHRSTDKVSKVIGKKITKTPNNRDANQSEVLVGAQPTKDKALRTTRRTTVWRPSFSHVIQTPLTRDKAKKLSMASPESLNLKRSRSGRLLVPPIANWCQEIIYDMDGSITGITGVDVLKSPCKGSKSEPARKKKKLR